MLWFVLLHGAYAAIELQHLVTVTSDVGSEAVRICACVEDAQIHAFQFDNDAGYDIVLSTRAGAEAPILHYAGIAILQISMRRFDSKLGGEVVFSYLENDFLRHYASYFLRLIRRNNAFVLESAYMPMVPVRHIFLRKKVAWWGQFMGIDGFQIFDSFRAPHGESLRE